MSSHHDQPSVTVLGLGPMGRALAGAFLDAGLHTTVWNRTPGRDHELLARGATVAATAEDAVAASDLTVVCVVDYDAVDTILRRDTVADALKGRTVVNLTADTPTRARDLATWAAEHGVAYLDGAIMTPAATIGTQDAVFIYSGPTELHRRHSDVLETLGGTHTHLGEDIGRAAAYDLALLDIFWTAMAGYAHALTLAKAEGITARELAPFAQGIAAILPPIIEQTAGHVDDGTFTGENNPITSAAASMSHIVHAAESHGIDTSVMRAAETQARHLITHGHGDSGFTRIVEILRPH